MRALPRSIATRNRDTLIDVGASAKRPIAAMVARVRTWRMKLAILQAAAPLARLIGHSLAAAVGFCALAAISLIPIQVVKLLTLLGFSQIARPLRVLEQTLLFADICLFAVTFVSGVAVFAAETIDAARRRISKILGANDRDR